MKSPITKLTRKQTREDKGSSSNVLDEEYKIMETLLDYYVYEDERKEVITTLNVDKIF